VLRVGVAADGRDGPVPLLRFVQRRAAELPPPARWADGLPLMLTGLLNRHPREATEDLVQEFVAVAPRGGPAA